MVSYAMGVPLPLFVSDFLSSKLSSCPGLSRASTSFRPQKQVVDGRVKPGHDGVRSRSFLRRLRPRLLRPAQSLERLGHAEYAEIIEALPDDLHADRKTLPVIAAIDRSGRV